MILLPCPYLGKEVEFVDERVAHVTARHPDLLPAHVDLIAKTLQDPDLVRVSARTTAAKEFSRWYAELLNGKHVIVVVMMSRDSAARPRIVTAYITGRMARGNIGWSKN